MISKYSSKIKLLISILAIAFSIVVAGFFVINVSIRSVKVEELQPITSKTSVVERNQGEKATIAALVKITEVVKSSEAVFNFQIVTDQGENLLVLINKKIGLSKLFVPGNLVSIENLVAAYPGARLKSEAANAVKEMFDSAKQEKGINFIVVSSFRSYQDQVKVFNNWVASAGLASAESFSARAGHSQHQLGTTVDIGVSGKANFSESFGVSFEGVWLAENSYKFGYVLSYPKGKEKITGYSYEPWHFRYIGKANAQKMISTGLILEEFLQKYGTW